MTNQLESLRGTLFLTLSAEEAAMVLGGQAEAGTSGVKNTYKSDGTYVGEELVLDPTNPAPSDPRLD
ncbi:MAG TPA: hypothetical protein VFY65_09960 [Longimicrobium sp.]|nr:hypothetical protein [Longimicrobium sp.]